MKINFEKMKKKEGALQFFLKNYEAIMEQTNGVGIDWDKMSKTMDALGIKGRDGTPIKASNARRTWYRVQKSRRQNDRIAPKKPPEPQSIERKPTHRVKEAVKQIETILDSRKVLPNSLPPSEITEIAHTGPRPVGLPDNIPLSALVPLTATGRTPDGKNYDYRENMPGYPKCSYFDLEIQWARVCWAIAKAKPDEYLTKDERRFIDFLARFPGIR